MGPTFIYCLLLYEQTDIQFGIPRLTGIRKQSIASCEIEPRTGPDPLSDSVVRLDHLLWEMTSDIACHLYNSVQSYD